jgi:acyl dehydratase
MLRVDKPADLIEHEHADLGTSGWRTIDQPMIDAFAKLTGDTHWLHTDPEKAARLGPFNGTIAHGFMTLALITSSMNELLDIGGAKQFVNYGLDRVRFTGPVKSGARIRLRQRLESVKAIEGGVRVTTQCVLEIENAERPAVVADFIFLALS